MRSGVVADAQGNVLAVFAPTGGLEMDAKGDAAMTDTLCEGCGQHSFLIPLHGGKGGPLRCPLCVGAWNAEHGRKRRAGRVVIRAIMAFYEAGGTNKDLDKLKHSAACAGLEFGPDLGIWADPLGYMDGIAKLDSADVDLTSELLADALKLTHPDHHPPERQQLAHSVTQRLLALQPFVFPAPKPKPDLQWAPDQPAPERSRSEMKTSQPRYPCADCAATVPYFYCDACKAEYERREQKEFEKRTAKQRADYKRRRERALSRRPLRRCEACGAEFKRTRADARYCSDTCRKRAHRTAIVTGKHNPGGMTTTSRDNVNVWVGRILALLEQHPAVFLNDLLPEDRTRAQYQALSLAAVKLEAAGKIDSWSYSWRWGRPGHKVLLKKGQDVEKLNHHIHRLTAKDRQKFASDARVP